MNAMRNLTGTGGIAADKATDERDYGGLATSLRDLQRSGDLVVGVETTAKDAVPSLTLIFSTAGKASQAYQKTCRTLNVACDGRTVYLRQGIAASAPNGDAANIATRSMYSAMYFLSQGVDIPPDDAARGAAVQNPNTGLMAARGGLFHVRTSATEPQQTSVKIFYRNAWFYIPDTDADSKVTFALMSMFLMLQAGDTAKITPLIALPAM